MPAFDFELTISGIFALAVRSSDPRPKYPIAVDVVCPNAHTHRPRLNYQPIEGHLPLHAPEPEMAIDPAGGRIASLDLRSKALNLTFAANPTETFTMEWGPEDAVTPPAPADEAWMNWIPTLRELGFGGFTIPGPGLLPPGASARVTLPPGELKCRDVVKRRDNQYILFEFPATGDQAGSRRPIVKALANEVVFSARGVTALVVTDHHGKTVLSSPGPAEPGPLRMSLSNDMDVVPHDYGTGDKLQHMGHLDVLVLDNEFQAPYVIRTGEITGIDPICDGAIFIYDYEGRKSK